MGVVGGAKASTTTPFVPQGRATYTWLGLSETENGVQSKFSRSIPLDRDKASGLSNANAISSGTV